MIKYENYMETRFFLSNSQEPNSFLRSKFDFGTRQKRMLRGYATYNMRIVVEYWELMQFQTMWEDLNYGADKFKTDMTLHGIISTDKTVRFTAPYALKEMGCMMYEVTAPVEMIRKGTSLATTCPLVPFVGLTTEDDNLTPCGEEN